MITENVVLMRQAREALKGKWGLAIGTSVVYLVVAGGCGQIPYIGSVGSLIIGGPMSLGFIIFSLSLARNQEARLEQIFEGFKKFGTSLAAYLFMFALILLWLLLLIVPGIIAAISYSLTFYIIAEDNEIGAMEAIDKSKKMMDGHKLRYFYLTLRFIGLALLCILTLGIGFFWLLPFMQVTYAKFYDDVKANTISAEGTSASPQL